MRSRNDFFQSHHLISFAELHPRGRFEIRGEAFNKAVDSSSRSCRCARCDKIELHGRVMRVAPISDEKYGEPTARCGMPGGMMRVSKYSKPSMFFLVGFVVCCGCLQTQPVDFMIPKRHGL